MFLDDQLLKIGREADLSNDKGVAAAVSKMINTCMYNASKNIRETNASYSSMRSTFKRIDITWTKVSEQLKKEGRGFVKPDGFKIFVQSKEEFKGLL